MGYCHYCKQDKTLIKAHIIPKHFYLDYKEEKFVLVDALSLKTKIKQSGTLDKNILCADCDGKILKKFDDEGYRILLNEIPKHTVMRTPTEAFYHLKQEEFNYELLRKFFISILWRASISKLDENSEVSLGMYEEKALDILKGKNSYDNLFKILIFKFPDNLDYNKVVFTSKAKFGNCITYVINMAGYHILVIVNMKNFNPRLKEHYRNYLLQKENLFVIESKMLYMHNVQGITRKWNEMLQKGFRPPNIKY